MVANRAGGPQAESNSYFSGATKGVRVTVAGLAAKKNLPVKFLEDVGVKDLAGDGVGITYWDETGQEVLFVRYRGVPGGPRFDQPKGVKLQPYGLWKLADRGQDVTLAITEGESDSWALWYHGI